MSKWHHCNPFICNKRATGQPLSQSVYMLSPVTVHMNPFQFCSPPPRSSIVLTTFSITVAAFTSVALLHPEGGRKKHKKTQSFKVIPSTKSSRLISFIRLIITSRASSSKRREMASASWVISTISSNASWLMGTCQWCGI